MKCLLGCISLILSKWKGKKNSKKNIFCRPTYPMFSWPVSGNTIYFLGLITCCTYWLLSPTKFPSFFGLSPLEDAGRLKSRIIYISSVSPACCKRRLNGAVCRNHRIKRVVPCRCRTGTLKNPAKCLWHWEPDRRYNFFFSPPAHLCHHIYDWNIVACDVKHQ